MAPRKGKVVTFYTTHNNINVLKTNKPYTFIGLVVMSHKLSLEGKSKMADYFRNGAAGNSQLDFL